MNHEDRLVSRRTLDMLFIFQILLNIIVLSVIIGLLYSNTARIGELGERQRETILQQNDAQLCSQYDIVLAVKSIGLDLGLPVEDIRPPDIEGLHCEDR